MTDSGYNLYMIKNYHKYKKFEDNFISSRAVNAEMNLKLVEEMYKEAVSLGIFRLVNPLEGTDLKTRLAKILNSVSKIN